MALPLFYYIFFIEFFIKRDGETGPVLFLMNIRFHNELFIIIYFICVMSDDDCGVCDDGALLLSGLKNEHNGYDRLQLNRVLSASASVMFDPRWKKRGRREQRGKEPTPLNW